MKHVRLFEQFVNEADKADRSQESVNEAKPENNDKDFVDFLSSRQAYSRSTNWKVIKKDGKYSFESDDKSGKVRVMYGENPIAFGYIDWSTGGYQIEHSSWKNTEKPFQFADDIIKYFKSNKIKAE